MLITAHWSASMRDRLRDYHLEFAIDPLSDSLYELLYKAESPADVDWHTLLSHTQIYKNFEFGTKTGYGTWHLNSDPRDGTPNVEIAALTMGGTDVKTTGPWGSNPYKKAHAWIHAGLIARVAQLKFIDINGSFDVSVEPTVLQNGPIFNVSTHGERAMQTNDEGQDNIPTAGYFDYSGDSNCRGDIAALDESDAHLLDNLSDAEHVCKASAAWLRSQAHSIKVSGITDFWNLDKACS